MQETRNNCFENCCEFLASDGVIFQSDTKPFFKTPVFGALLNRVGKFLTVDGFNRGFNRHVKTPFLT